MIAREEGFRGPRSVLHILIGVESVPTPSTCSSAILRAASVVDTLIGRATKASSGWRPARPSQRIVEEAKSFTDAARHIGHADPAEVTEHPG